MLKIRQTGETISFSQDLEPIVAALASSAAIALENQILLQDHKNLLDAFVQVIAQAIDAKSSHTSAHCQRVPALTELLHKPPVKLKKAH
jgi:ATP phosphoribosyltransferase